MGTFFLLTVLPSNISHSSFEVAVALLTAAISHRVSQPAVHADSGTFLRSLYAGLAMRLRGSDAFFISVRDLRVASRDGGFSYVQGCFPKFKQLGINLYHQACTRTWAIRILFPCDMAVSKESAILSSFSREL